MPIRHPDLVTPQHRELYFFALFRVLEAGILGIVAFTPLGQTMADIREPLLLQILTAGYFFGALFICTPAGSRATGCAGKPLSVW